MSQKPIPNWESIKSVHIVGVCGTLMGAFAEYLKRRGLRVTGSDQNIYPPMSDVLKRANVELLSGYSAENIKNLNPKPDLIVIGNVIQRVNPEAQEILNGDYAYTSLPEAMEKLFLVDTRNLIVAGTHGKTTTSSLLSHVLTQLGQKPNYFIGGVAKDLPCSFQVENLKKGHPFILEGDEYDTAFWDKVPKFNHYLPDDVILTSVEYDHADIYPDMNAVIRAFEGLADRIRPGGRLIGCTDFEHVRGLFSRVKVPLFTYGSDSKHHARFTPRNIRSEKGLTHFEVFDENKKVDDLTLKIPGQHNVMNALAVWVESQALGLAKDKVRSALSSFEGVKRRQEERGERRGVLVIDDFAHHPTAVKVTLQALKLKYPGRRVVAVFEPRSATSRRKVFQKDYADAFSEADATFIAIPYDQSKIPSNDHFSSDELVENLKARKKEAFLMNSVEDGVVHVAEFCKKNDLLAVLSNGGFGGFIPKVLDLLGR